MLEGAIKEKFKILMISYFIYSKYNLLLNVNDAYGDVCGGGGGDDDDDGDVDGLRLLSCYTSAKKI